MIKYNKTKEQDLPTGCLQETHLKYENTFVTSGRIERTDQLDCLMLAVGMQEWLDETQQATEQHGSLGTEGCPARAEF